MELPWNNRNAAWENRLPFPSGQGRICSSQSGYPGEAFIMKTVHPTRLLNSYNKFLLPGRRQAALWVLAALVSLSLPGCGEDSSAESTTDNSSTDLQLNVSLPSSVSTDSSYTGDLSGSLGHHRISLPASRRALSRVLTAVRNSESDIREAFDVIREMAGTAEDLGQLCSDILVEVEGEASSNGFNWQTTIVVDEEGLRLQVGPGSSRDRALSVWYKASGTKLLEAEWDGAFVRGSRIQGFVRLSGAVFESPDMFLQMEFDTKDDQGRHAMLVQATGLEPGGFEKLQLWAARGEDGLLSVSGNMYFADLIDPVFTTPRNYMFVGTVDEETNLAVVDIALPEASENSASGIFDNFSYGDVYAAVTTIEVNNTQALCNGVKKVLDGNPLATCSSLPGSYTVEQVKTALNNSLVSGLAEVQEVLFAFSLENSFYTDEDGYVANAESPGSGWDAPAAANAAIIADSALTVAPSMVAGLSLAFDEPDMPSSTTF
jgi:hypothetical protein